MAAKFQYGRLLVYFFIFYYRLSSILSPHLELFINKYIHSTQSDYIHIQVGVRFSPLSIFEILRNLTPRASFRDCTVLNFDDNMLLNIAKNIIFWCLFQLNNAWGSQLGH